MQKLIDSVLNAAPLSVALLLCLVLAYVLYTAIQKKREKQNDGPTRSDGHILWRVERLELDMRELAAEVHEILPKVIRVEEQVGSLKDKVEELHDSLKGGLERVLERLTK